MRERKKCIFCAATFSYFCMANSQPAEGRLRPKIIYRGRSIYFPPLLVTTPNLKALIQQYTSITFGHSSKVEGSYTTGYFHHFWTQLQTWRLLYNSILPSLLDTAPKLKALIQQDTSITFGHNSKLEGSYTTGYFHHFRTQLQTWRLLYNRILPSLLDTTPNLKALIQQVQDTSITFGYNSKVEGSYTTVFFHHFCPQLQSWRL